MSKILKSMFGIFIICALFSGAVSANNTVDSVNFQGFLSDTDSTDVTVGMYCTGGKSAFGGGGGTASGTFMNCIGGEQAFGGNGNTTGGFFWDCVGGDEDSFGPGGVAKDCYDGTNWINANPIP